MKRVLNIFMVLVFIGAVAAITYLTVYILKNKGVKEEVEQKVAKSVEKVTSNIAGNTLSEIYNVYLNKQRHKVKFEYSASVNEENIGSVNLVVYFDGKSLLEEDVVKNLMLAGETIWDNENINNYVKLNENNIKIFTSNDKEYLILEVGYFKEGVLAKYFAFNDVGDEILKDEILVMDTTKYYVNSEGEELGIFYGNDDGQILAKIEKDTIYSLVAQTKKEVIKIDEYKYTIKEDKFEKELINTYDNITLKKDEQEITSNE